MLNSTDYMWYKFNYIKKIKDRISVLEYDDLSIFQSMKFFKYELKFRFSLNNIKFSKYIEFTKNQSFLLSRLLSIYENWYSATDQFTNLSSISLYNHVMNQGLFSWIKKQNSSILLNMKDISMLNVIVNKKTYIYNMKKYYIQFL